MMIDTKAFQDLLNEQPNSPAKKLLMALSKEPTKLEDFIQRFEAAEKNGRKSQNRRKRRR